MQILKTFVCLGNCNWACVLGNVCAWGRMTEDASWEVDRAWIMQHFWRREVGFRLSIFESCWCTLGKLVALIRFILKKKTILEVVCMEHWR